MEETNYEINDELLAKVKSIFNENTNNELLNFDPNFRFQIVKTMSSIKRTRL